MSAVLQPKFPSQRVAKDTIQQAIDSNDRAVLKALVMIFDQQTAAEQSTEQTHELNGVGFSAFDAEILTSFAKQYKRKGFLSPKQMEIARKKIRGYWKQLAKLSGRL